MGTEIKTWQVVDNKLARIEGTLRAEGHIEQHLESWLVTNPEILGADIVVIGRQVKTRSGPIDLLGIDASGSAVIIEIKREDLPRECLAQAIDYASDVADWTIERLGEICSEYKKKPLEEVFATVFPDVEIGSINLTTIPRIILVGFSLDASLQRMIAWLSASYAMNINAIILSYSKTAGGEELLTRTSVISEEIERERGRKQKKFEIPMSDEPGEYDSATLKNHLIDYLGRDSITNRRIREVLLPACLETDVLTREELKRAFIKYYPAYDAAKVGSYLSIASSQLGMKKNDFLRQVIRYEYPKRDWEKDNFSIKKEYLDLVRQVLDELNRK